MTRRYHFVIVFDEETKEWDIDIDGEEILFPNGSIFNSETMSYEYGYAGDGKFTGLEEQLSEQVSEQMDNWNLLLKTGEKQ